MESKKINQLATELTPALSDLTIIGDPTTGISKKITLSQMASLFTGTVEEYANLAAFPLVGVADTIYIALDTNVLYRWNIGTSAYVELSPNIINSLVFSDANGFDGNISLVGSVATLTITTALTTGSVPFIGASGALSQDNANLFFDDTNNRLGINTNAPTTALDVFGSGIIGRINGTSTNNAFLGFASAGTNKWSIGNVQSDHRFRIYNEATTSELVSVLSTGEFGIGIANPTTKFHIDGAASALIANLDANVSVAKSISFRSDNSARINLEVSGTESGSNAGADFFLRTYTDAGALLETPFSIVRSTGVTTIKSLTLTNVLSIANGGTGSATKNFVDLTTTQSIGGAKTFTSILTGTAALLTSSSNALTLSNAGNLWLRIERGSVYANIGVDSVGTFYNTNSNHKFYTADGTINPLTITSAGNVGVNTDSPPSKFSVFWNKSTAFSGSAVYDIQAYNASNHGGTLAFGGKYNSGGDYTEWSAIGGMKTTTTDNDVSGDLNFYTRSGGSAMIERMKISSIGDLTVNGGATVGKLTLGYNFYILNDQSPEVVSFVASSGTSIFRWMRQTTTESMRLTTSGALCIGRTSGGGELNLQGTIYLYSTSPGAGNSTMKYNTSTGAMTYDTSARAYKKDIENLNYGLAEILQMSPKKYKYISDDANDIGFIADEMYEIVPEIVALANNEIMNSDFKEGEPVSINYDRFAPIFVNAIKELKAEIEELKALINK